MTFDEWQAEVPDQIKEDSLWRMEAYRLSLFVGDLAMADGQLLLKNRPTWSHADQLLRSGGAISADIAEGYSRSTGKDRAKYYEYALGSARETRDWYYKTREFCKAEVTTHRVELLTQIIRLLVRMSDNERKLNKRLQSLPSITNHQSP